MFAVMTTGGKQYRVEAGTELFIERVAADAGASITFDRVLLLGDGDDVTVGAPTVEGATITGTVLGEALGPKLIVFKFKQKVKYRRRAGHRQHLTRVRIDEINPSGSKSKARASAEPEKAEAAPAVTEEKPKRIRRAAAATDEPKSDEKPKRTRKPAAKAQAESEE
jgi:large subunit ribosomal protein L21